MTKNKPFKLFSDFIMVKGYTRSILSDLKNGKYFFIPNSLFDIINKFEGNTIQNVLDEYSAENHNSIIEYFDFFITNKVIFFTDSPDNFPKLSTQWNSTSVITNAIIDIGSSFKKINYIDVINQLANLGCKAIQLRFYDKTEIQFIKRIIDSSVWSTISDIQLVLKFNEDLDENLFFDLYDVNERLSSILIHSSPFDKTIKLSKSPLYSVFFIKTIINNSSHCGVISPSYFVNNITFYNESNFFNNCLNKKIGIDIDGNIKNCPTFNFSYGNVLNEKLKDIVFLDSFQKIWKLNKDLIDDCKICEFRYMCRDCRVSSDGKVNNTKKSYKCKYNPNTGEWEV